MKYRLFIGSYTNYRKYRSSGMPALIDVKISNIDQRLPPDLKPQVMQARDKRASPWLNALPIREQGPCLKQART